MKEKIYSKFEKVVADIERRLAPEGALVTHNDRVKDKVTDQERQIDATIKYKIGSVPVLIAVECRKRKNKEDVRWIEELCTKREKVGAAILIAVSEKGFSEPAKASAIASGIQLRTLQELSEVTTREWLSSSILQVGLAGWRVEDLVVIFDSDETEVEINPEVQKRVQSSYDAVISENKELDKKIILREIGQSFLEKEGLTQRYGEQFGGTLVVEDPFYIETNKGNLKIKEIRFKIEVVDQPLPLTSAKTYEYSDMNTSIGKYTQLEFSKGEYEVGIDLFKKS